MATMGVNLTGFNELQTMLRKLPDEVQLKAVKPALRKMEKRFHQRVVQAFSGMPVGVVTASILTAIASAKVRLERTVGRRLGLVRYVFNLPTDREDSIAVNALEYGWTDRFGHYHKARAPLRGVVDTNQKFELSQVVRDIKKGIERQAKRLIKKAAA